jgi:hypothetical protein
MKAILIGSDELVAKALFKVFNLVPIHFDMAIGIIEDGLLAGGILLHWWTGPNIYLSYYGPDTVSLGLSRSIARIILEKFDVSRVTMHVHEKNKRLKKGLGKIGAIYEGKLRCFYGSEDRPMNAAAQYVILRPTIEWLAKIEGKSTSTSGIRVNKAPPSRATINGRME